MSRFLLMLRHGFLVAPACVFIFSGCAEMKYYYGHVPEIAPGFLAGYLEAESLPNSLSLVNPPPETRSHAFELDLTIYGASKGFRGTPRWKQAVKDTNLAFPGAAYAFSCALNAPISEHETPHLYMLMRRAMTDAVLSTRSVKEFYKRPPPFVFSMDPTCTPDDEKPLSEISSYPSKHACIGWTWALILAELAPERGDMILERGRSFAESRVVCGTHWQSDIDAGFIIGAGVVARLLADSEFREDFNAARIEMAAVRANGLFPQHDCNMEKAALSLKLHPSRHNR
ncbi:MAG: phosphatase PAP2 family protein [Syntrophales bacterium]|nr:phosphatase PAP2 family protein [Syntrophales bacterium]MDD5232921.1 phosphatase PAP2 family protein [Syntrophales bacterium]